MNIFQAYIAGFKKTGRSLLMTTLIYAINLVLGIVVTIPFLGGLREGAGRSLSINNLLSGYDHTVILELLNNTSFHLRHFVQQGFWIAILYLFISIFLTGGILYTLSDSSYPFTLERFINGCRRFFLRFLKISAYALILELLIALLIILIFSFVIRGSFTGRGSEKVIFYLSVSGIGILSLFLVYILIIADYARFFLVKYDSNQVLRSLWESTRFVTRNIIFTYGLYLMLLVAPVILIYLFMLFSNIVEMGSGVAILLMFIVQQIFIWSRVFTRIWTFDSQLEYYLNKSY